MSDIGAVYGVLIVFGASVVIASGFTLQKVAHIRLKRIAEAARAEKDGKEIKMRPYVTQWRWWLGLTCQIGGEGGNFFAYGFAPASLIAPLGSVSVVMNCLFNTVFLHEKLPKRSMAGIGVALAGATVIVLARIILANDHPPPDGPLLLELITSPIFIVFGIIWIGIVVALMIVAYKWGHRHVAVYTSLCSSLGGITVATTKAISSLTLHTLQGNPQFEYFILYVALALFPFVAISQTHFLNKAMSFFPGNVVIPVYYCLFSLSSIILSGVLYQEFVGFEWWRYVLFIVGVSLTMLGVYLITGGHFHLRHRGSSSARHRKDDPEDDGIDEGDLPSVNRRAPKVVQLEVIKSPSPSRSRRPGDPIGLGPPVYWDPDDEEAGNKPTDASNPPHRLSRLSSESMRQSRGSLDRGSTRSSLGIELDSRDGWKTPGRLTSPPHAVSPMPGSALMRTSSGSVSGSPDWGDEDQVAAQLVAIAHSGERPRTAPEARPTGPPPGLLVGDDPDFATTSLGDAPLPGFARMSVDDAAPVDETIQVPSPLQARRPSAPPTLFVTTADDGPDPPPPRIAWVQDVDVPKAVEEEQ